MHKRKIRGILCTSCGACMVACPQKSITMKKNRLAQFVPKIDKKKCINCGICDQICPQVNNPSKKYPKECYVAWSKNEDDYITSASGGIGAVIARHQLKHSQKVYGCDYTSEGELHHFCLNDERDVEKSKSSKYSQSKSYECYSEIKSLLSEGYKVVFIGTPCQCAGLKNTVKNKSENLFTVDLVCHGTPPNEYLREHFVEMGIDFPVSKIRFRGEFDQKMTVWMDNDIIYQRDRYDDLYFTAFYKNVISCNSCFECQYACPERVSDITIGDFWGLGKLNQIERMSKRPSLILINTEKGKDFFNEIKDEIFYEQRVVTEGINGNGRLLKPPGKNNKAKIFQLLYSSKIFGFNFSLRILNYLVRKKGDFFK